MRPSEQLTLALDEQTPEEVLGLLWRKSRSVNVRKAIAKNANAGPRVLREAARLYLEEVLENPGFPMLELFVDDPWIKRISQAYSDPDSFVDQNYYYFHRAGDEVDQCCWAVLLSPQLTPRALDKVLQNISLVKLRRAFKNQKVLTKIKTTYVDALKSSEELWPFDLETLLILHREGVIDNDYLFEGLSNYGVASTSCRKATFSKFLNKVCEQYRSSKDSQVARLFAKTFLICRGHVLYWLPHSHSREDLLWSGELYTRVLKYMLEASRYKVLVGEHIKVIGSIVANHLRVNFFGAKPEHTISNYTKESLTKAFEFLKHHGVLDAKFSTFGFVLPNRLGAEALEACDIEVKEFFVKAGCLGSWVGVTGNDPKYKIINDVNEEIFSREGITNNLLFLSCSTRKIVSLEQSTHIF
jgi:hypothetical protein